MTSCLEKIPGSSIPEKNAMRTFADAEQMLTGIYAGFKSADLYSGLLTLCPDIQADLVYAVDGYTNTYGNIWQWDIRSTNAEIESVYAALYSQIGRCNFFLDRVEEVRNSLTDDNEIESLDQYTGEVYCARALCYAELIKCFCKAYDPATAANELGVVLVSSYANPGEARRATLYDSYQFVIKDLERAEALLDEDDDEFGNEYLSAGSVEALRSRVALYMQDWQTAIDYSSKLIDRKSKVYRLADAKTAYTTINNITYSYYDYLWAYNVSFETIWRIGFTTTSYGGALGRPFLQIETDYTYFYPDYVPATWTLNAYEENDLRYNALFASKTTGYAHGLTWPLMMKYYGNRNFINTSNIFQVSMPQVFRLSEQYLIRAEAYCNLPSPDYAKASADLTTLRAARYPSGMGSLSVSADNWLERISEERMRELYMEGFRLQDLKRWKKGFTRTPQLNSLVDGSSLKIEASNPLFVWPIPQHELNAPGSMIEPNESNN